MEAEAGTTDTLFKGENIFAFKVRLRCARQAEFKYGGNV